MPPSRTPSHDGLRGRARTRSRTPPRAHSRSSRRSISPRSEARGHVRSRTPLSRGDRFGRHNGSRRGFSQSRSGSRTPPVHREARRSYSRSLSRSPVPRSTKVSPRRCLWTARWCLTCLHLDRCRETHEECPNPTPARDLLNLRRHR